MHSKSPLSSQCPQGKRGLFLLLLLNHKVAVKTGYALPSQGAAAVQDSQPFCTHSANCTTRNLLPKVTVTLKPIAPRPWVTDRLTAGDLGKMLLGSCLGQATAINHSTTAAEEAAAGFQGHIGQAPVGEAGRARTRSRGAGEAAGRMFARHLHYGPSRPPLRTLNINYI